MYGLRNDHPNRYLDSYWCPGEQLSHGWWTLEDLNEWLRVDRIIRNWGK